MAFVLPGTSDAFWRDRSYKTRHIPNLPRDFRLRSHDVTVTIDYAREGELTSSLRKLSKAAAERADNVGIDEFDSDRQKSFAEFSEIFIARWPSSDKTDVDAFITIGPTFYCYDHLDSCLAEVQVIRSRDVSDATYCDLVELAFELAKQLDLGYTVCLTSVAGHCHQIMRLLEEKSGFKPLLRIPLSVNIGRGIGLVDNVLMRRHIQPVGYVRQPRSTDEVIAMLSRHGITDGPDDDVAFRKVPLPVAPNLPMQRILNNGSLVINIRNAKHDDDRAMYDLMTTAIQRGEGYSRNQFPNLAAFRRFRLMSRTCIVVMEDMSTGEIVGTATIGPARFTRSESAKYAASSTTLSKKVQSSGVMKNEMSVMHEILKAFGFEAFIGTYLANNVRSRRLCERYQYRSLGVVPSSGYVVGSGWMDAVIVYRRLDANEQPEIDKARL